MSVNVWFVVTLVGLLAAAVGVVVWVNRRRGRAAVAGPPPKLDENVQFTVYRPQAVEPSKWYPLLAFAHLSERPADAPAGEPEPAEEVRRQARAQLGQHFDDFREVTPDTLYAVPRESDLTFVPEFEGIEFRPAQQSFLWLGQVESAEFRMRAGPELEGRVVKGRVAVYLGAKLTADVELSIRVDSRKAQQLAGEPPAADTASPYRKVFVSYSRRDETIVSHFVAIARASGDEYLRDVTNLRAGEVWSRRLEEMIEEANVFQLFWSSHSMRSAFVRQEWEHALSLNRPNFIRPTFWEEPMPADEAAGLPPEALAALNFYRLPLRLDENVRSRLLPDTSGTPHLITKLQRGKTIVSAVVVAVLVARVAVFKPPEVVTDAAGRPRPTPTASPSPNVTPTPAETEPATPTPADPGVGQTNEWQATSPARNRPNRRTRGAHADPDDEGRYYRLPPPPPTVKPTPTPARQTNTVEDIVQTQDGREMTLPAPFPSPCPYPVFVAGPDAVDDGDLVTFHAEVAYAGQSPLKYVWKVNPPTARILSGAGTPTITVDTEGLGGRRVVAVLVVDDGSGDRNCRQTSRASTSIRAPAAPSRTPRPTASPAPPPSAKPPPTVPAGRPPVKARPAHPPRRRD